MPDIIGDQSRPRLHVRTVLGAAGSPAAGKTGYLYRLDLTNVIGALDVSCATALKLDVGPTAKFEYSRMRRRRSVRYRQGRRRHDRRVEGGADR